MVTASGQDNAALKALHHWLKKQWPINQSMSEQQQNRLTQICQQIYQQHRHHDQHYIRKNITYSQPGFKQDQFHSGFLFMGQQSATPLHDHAESFSLSLVLSGAVKISIYQHIENNQNNLSHLLLKETLQLQAGNFTFLLADSPLVHKLTTTSQPACLLDIHYPHFSSDKRNLYLPVAFTDKQLACERISEGKFPT